MCNRRLQIGWGGGGGGDGSGMMSSAHTKVIFDCATEGLKLIGGGGWLWDDVISTHTALQNKKNLILQQFLILRVGQTTSQPLDVAPAMCQNVRAKAIAFIMGRVPGSWQEMRIAGASWYTGLGRCRSVAVTSTVALVCNYHSFNLSLRKIKIWFDIFIGWQHGPLVQSGYVQNNGSICFFGQNVVLITSSEISDFFFFLVLMCTFRASCYSARLSWACTTPVIKWAVCLGQKVSC